MFNHKNMSVMSYANGFTLWNYATEDSLESIKTAGYFNEAAPFARKGDMVLVVADKEAALEPAIVFVKSVTENTVEVKDIIPAAI